MLCIHSLPFAVHHEWLTPNQTYHQIGNDRFFSALHRFHAVRILQRIYYVAKKKTAKNRDSARDMLLACIRFDWNYYLLFAIWLKCTSKYTERRRDRQNKRGKKSLDERDLNNQTFSRYKSNTLSSQFGCMLNVYYKEWFIFWFNWMFAWFCTKKVKNVLKCPFLCISLLKTTFPTNLMDKFSMFSMQLLQKFTIIGSDTEKSRGRGERG